VEKVGVTKHLYLQKAAERTIRSLYQREPKLGEVEEWIVFMDA
jgi:hypothetical protein